MQRYLFFAYGVVCHLLFLITSLYLVGFVGNFVVPKTIDTTYGDATGIAVATNLLLLGLFAVQHSVMARPGFKQLWTRIVPKPIERSTYVLASALVLFLLVWQWRGIDTVVWNVEQPALRAMIWAVFALGWLLVPFAAALINQFDLVGTRQVWLHLQGQEYEPLPFGVPLFYKHVRHPLYIGWMIAFWAIPTMTVGHLLFAAVLTAYMVLAAIVEERDLVNHFGPVYQEYRQHVPMFVPRLRPVAKISQAALEREQVV